MTGDFRHQRETTETRMKKFFFLFLISLSFSARAAVEINDTEIESVLYQLVRPIASAADIPDGRLKIHVIASDDFNAFVQGGENIYIYTGLIQRLENPGALQAVVAHEIGHMIGGHMAQMSARMRAEMTRSLIVQALGVGLMVANPQAGAGLLAGAGGMAQQSLLAFTRDEERIADDMGWQLLEKAGLPTAGFLDVFKAMQNLQSEDRVNPFQINHPLTAERLAAAKAKIKDQGPKTKNKKYEMIRAKLAGYLEPIDRVRQLYPKNDYALAIADMQIKNLKSARARTQRLIAADKKNPYFYELLGDIEFQSGNYDASAQAYESSLSLCPPLGERLSAKQTGGSCPQIQVALALVLSERGDKERAIELCKKSLLQEKSPLAFYVLSKSYEDRGFSDWAMAEYHALQNNKEKSAEYARRAQKELPPDSPEYLKSEDLLRK